MRRYVVIDPSFYAGAAVEMTEAQSSEPPENRPNGASPSDGMIAKEAAIEAPLVVV